MGVSKAWFFGVVQGFFIPARILRGEWPKGLAGHRADFRFA